MKANLPPILLPQQERDTHHLHSPWSVGTSPLASPGCKLQQKLHTLKGSEILADSEPAQALPAIPFRPSSVFSSSPKTLALAGTWSESKMNRYQFDHGSEPHNRSSVPLPTASQG